MLDAWMWARAKKDKFGVRGGPKESRRWIEGYERIAEMAADLPAACLVYVADRAADLMPRMARAADLGTPADWLVRAAHNRCLPDGEKLWQHTTASPSMGEIAFTMASRRGVKARAVRQQWWVERVALPAGKGKMVAATCLAARQKDAPAGAKSIDWRLLTNREVADVNGAIELTDWYRARWDRDVVQHYEECVPSRGAAAGHGRTPCARNRIVHGRRLAHCAPEATGTYLPDVDATLFFDTDEIRGAFLLMEMKQPAKPTLNEVLRLIARLGAFIGRKATANPARRPSGLD